MMFSASIGNIAAILMFASAYVPMSVSHELSGTFEGDRWHLAALSPTIPAPPFLYPASLQSLVPGGFEVTS